MQEKRLGRPATGRTTATLSIRLPLVHVGEIKRRAQGVGRTVNEWLVTVIAREIRHRPGEATRRRSS